MKFYDFSKFIVQHKNRPQDPKRYPTSITLSSQVWDEIKRLAKYTSQFNYEHSTTLFNVDKDIVATPPVKGTKTDVYTHHQVELKYIPKTANLYEKQIFINGRMAKKSAVKTTNIPSEPKVVSLFNIHSHPRKEEQDKICFSFFSETDLNTLFSQQALCMGLVTDRFFLACKHSGSPPYLSNQQRQILDQINIQFFNEGELKKELLEQLGAVFYGAEFGKGLEKLN